MTVNATPLWMQGLSTHTANMYRRFLDGMSNLKGGIFASTDFTVTQNGTPNMTVNVAPGMAFVRGTEDATYQGMYWVENQASQNVSISASHATLNRIDLVVLRIRDNAYSTGPSNDATAFVVVGTPASSPAAPAVPPNSFVLAQVTIGAAVTTILTANIANQRTTTVGQGYAGLRGAFRRVASSNKPTTNLQAFQEFIIDDTALSLQMYDGSAWRGLGAFTSPPIQIFTGTVSAGSATSDTAIITQNAIMTAPYPLTMIVEVFGEAGANGAGNNLFLQVTDEAGTSIIQSAGILNPGYLTVVNVASTANKSFSYMGKKDYTAGQTVGFRTRYHLDTSNIYISMGVKVTFVPKAT